MILVSHSYRVRDTRIAPFQHHIARAKRVRYDVGRVRYDVRKGAIRVSRTRYKCDTRIVTWYPIIIIKLDWYGLFAHYIRTLSVQYFQAKSVIIWLRHMIRKLAWKYCTPEWWVIMNTCARQIAHDRLKTDAVSINRKSAI